MKPCKRCGKKPQLYSFSNGTYYFSCNTLCWSGPPVATKEEAEAAWDELMGGEALTAEPEPRRPVAGFTVPDSDQPAYYSNPWVICNDGTVWELQNGWIQLPSIPGTPADRSGNE